MKKIVNIFLIISLVFITTYLNKTLAYAAVITTPQTEIIFLENGDYFEITISDVASVNSISHTMNSTSKTITKTKTTKYKDKDGATLWFVSIEATFSYNGITSQCTDCSHNASSFSPSWSIKTVSSSKSGNTATAIATYSYNIFSRDYTSSVTISCDKNGIVS